MLLCVVVFVLVYVALCCAVLCCVCCTICWAMPFYAVSCVVSYFVLLWSLSCRGLLRHHAVLCRVDYFHFSYILCHDAPSNEKQQQNRYIHCNGFRLYVSRFSFEDSFLNK